MLAFAYSCRSPCRLKTAAVKKPPFRPPKNPLFGGTKTPFFGGRKGGFLRGIVLSRVEHIKVLGVAKPQFMRGGGMSLGEWVKDF